MHHAVFDSEKNCCAVSLATASFLAAVKQVADQISVQVMFAAEIGNAFPVAVKNRAGLLGGKWGMHSVKPCLIVFDEKDSWADFCSSQLILIKKMLIESGVGMRLREERERLALNQADFGVAAGVSRGTQKAYELESSAPDTRYLQTLQGMGVDVYYVLTGGRVSPGAADLSPNEIQVLENFRAMPAGDRDVMQRTMAALADAATRKG